MADAVRYVCCVLAAPQLCSLTGTDAAAQGMQGTETFFDLKYCQLCRHLGMLHSRSFASQIWYEHEDCNVFTHVILHAISTTIPMIQAFHQALLISAFLGTCI